jgi:two-component sensor histidine kinase
MTCTQNLIADLRHRVANDLALIVFTLEAQRGGGVIQTADEALDKTIGALLALMLYYRRLYEVGSDVEPIDMGQHLENVMEGLRTSYLDRLGVSVERRLETVAVPPQMARDLGLVVAELVTNAAKHAFAGPGGRIRVELTRSRAGLVCRVRDSGRGADGAVLGRSSGGLAVAARFARSLGGSLAVESNAPLPGGAFIMKVPLPASKSQKEMAPQRPHSIGRRLEEGVYG